MYVEFWKPTLFGRKMGGWVQKSALDSLAADYHFQCEREEIPAFEGRFLYTATFADDNFESACATLLQLGVKAQFQLLCTKPRLLSFCITTDQPAGHILSHYFPKVRQIRASEAARMAAGKPYAPLRLTKLSIPTLPGTKPAGPSPIDLVPPEPVPEGAVVLGNLISPLSGESLGDVWMPRVQLTRGMLIAGMTGSGKTTTVCNLVESVYRESWVLSFDVKKEHRSMMHTVGAKVFRFQAPQLLTHNILKPVGPPDVWVKQVADLISQVINPSNPAVGSKDVLIETIDRLYREREIYSGGTDYPHLGHLTEALKELRETSGSGRAGGWADSALRVLNSMAVGATRNAFYVREGLALERLMDGVTVVELDGLGDPAAKSLLVSVLLQKIRNYYAERPVRKELEGLIVIEEAQNLLSQGSEATSVLTTTCREIRAYAIGLVFLAQMPSDMSHHSTANAGTIVCHRLLFPADRSMMASMLGLEPDQKSVLDELRPGRAVVRTDRLALVQVPRKERRPVRDDELPAVASVAREEVATKFPLRVEVARRTTDLAPRQLEVLVSLGLGEAIHPTGLKDNLGFSFREVRSVLTLLLRKGLVGYVKGKREGQGKPRSVYFLTAMGEEAFRSHADRYADRAQGASPNHTQVLQTVIERLQIRRKPHNRFDILYDTTAGERAIEVETGSNNSAQLLENLRKMVELQGEPWFVSATTEVGNRLQQLVAREVFSSRRSLGLKLASLEGLPEWEMLRFEPAAVERA